MAIISHEINGLSIPQRGDDGYVNATRLCKAGGKLLADYLRLDGTKAYLEALSLDMGIPISNLVQTTRGRGDRVDQSTWVHPDVAVDIGQWLSPQFRVAVNRWVREWMQNGTHSTPQQPSRGYWYERQLQFIKYNKIPPGYFCIFQEMHHFIWELENAGYVMPDVSPLTHRRMLPDISVGQLFCKHLRGQGVDVDALVRKYPHRYPDRPTLPVEANIYPDELLPQYRRWFMDGWKSQRSVDYFEERDRLALPPLHQVLGLPYTEQLSLLSLFDIVTLAYNWRNAD